MYKTKRYQDFTLANGEEIELEPEYTPADWIEPTIVEVGNYIIFGYLSHDSDCMNPLEYSDCMGVIHHHPRSRYGSRDSDYYDILGLDSYGDPVIDEDKLQKLWHDAVMAVPLTAFGPEYPEELRQQLAREEVGDFTVREQCRWAWRHHTRQGDVEVESDEEFDELVEAVEEHLDWSYNLACDDAWTGGDKDAVLLDLYDHSGCIWSVAGTGMNCRWDTSRGEAVWVPDKYIREELEGFADPKERRTRAVEYAEQAVEQYNAWSSGDCYGVIVQVHELDGTFVEEDACWAYIGGDYAEESLAEQVKWMAARYEDKAPPKNPNQMEMLI